MEVSVYPTEIKQKSAKQSVDCSMSDHPNIIALLVYVYDLCHTPVSACMYVCASVCGVYIYTRSRVCVCVISIKRLR